MSTTQKFSFTVAAALLCAAGAAVAEPSAESLEFRLSPDSAASHATAQIARRPDGSFVAAWYTYSDSEEVDIVAQVFSASGVPESPLIQVNQQAEGIQIIATVAMDAAGNFAVAWRSNDPGPDYQSIGIFARRFDAAGQPLGDEFQVNPEPQRPEHYMLDGPTLGMAPDGRFVVVWNGSNLDNGDFALYARPYDRDGVPGGTIRVADAYTSDSEADVVMRSDGSFVAVFHADSFQHVAMRAFRANGQPLFPVTDISPLPAEDALQGLPSIAAESDGDFQVSWTSRSGSPAVSDVFVRRFAASGAPRGDAIQVNVPGSPSDGFWTSVGVDASGASTVLWSQEDRGEVMARSFDRWGVSDGEPFVVSADPLSSLGYTGVSSRSVAFDGAGDFLVTWWRYSSGRAAVFARLYQAPLETVAPRTLVPVGNTQVGGTFSLSSLALLVAAGVLSRRYRRRRPTDAGRTSGSPGRY